MDIMDEKEVLLYVEWLDEPDNDDTGDDLAVVIHDDYPNYSAVYPSRMDGELELGSYLDHVYENNDPYRGSCSGCGGDGCQACWD